jgi:hypothetical protein
VRFASFLSGGFITAIVENLLESKLAKRTSVDWTGQKSSAQCFVTIMWRNDELSWMMS